MTKVITYGTYDLLHYGHIRLLERAKALGDYLIVGVTADDFDKTRGKINVAQSLMERVEAVRATGIADEIIIEEYEGQKIDDIKRLDVDIFTVGSDWEGYFDYLNEYCKVVYLPRTEGVSSSEIREAKRPVRLGLVGDTSFLNKVAAECKYVNGIHIVGICTNNLDVMDSELKKLQVVTSDFSELLDSVDALYIRTQPRDHYEQIKKALEKKVHVLCESPVVLNEKEYIELKNYALANHLVLMEAIKTAYATAYARLLLLIKGGKIGEVVSVDSACTSINHKNTDEAYVWDGVYEWAPTALLPVFHILGTAYKENSIIVKFKDREKKHDAFLKSDFVFDSSVASIRIGNGVKTEGELVVTGTKGYAYIPAPWWKTDYFEIRYENPSDNKRYFYQLDGEGIRYELVAFAKAIEIGNDKMRFITDEITESICAFMDRYNRPDFIIG